MAVEGNRVLVTDQQGVTVLQHHVPATLEFSCDGVPIFNGIFNFPILLGTRGELSFSAGQLPMVAVSNRTLPAGGGTEMTLDLTSGPVVNGPSSFGPGTTVFMQYWARIPGQGSHLSNSLEMVFAP